MSTATPDGDTATDRYERVLVAATAATEALVRTTPEERADWLDAVGAGLEAQAERLIQLAMQESHLGRERLTGELARTTFQLRLFGSVIRTGEYLEATIDHADPSWGMGARPDLRRMQRPIGPVAVFAASNFPFAFSIAGGDTASAVAAGAPVIVKTHPGHPQLSQATAATVRSALRAAGAPDGTFDTVDGVETGRRLVADERIAAASFTGSEPAGRELFDIASGRPRPIPFFGELGSVNPTFVTRGAAEQASEAIASGFVGSMTLGAGQFCTKPGVFAIPNGSALAELVVEKVRTVAAAPMLNDRIASGFRHALADLAEQPDVEVLADGAQGTPADAPGPSILRTDIDAVLREPERLLGERFGPAALLVGFDSDDQLLQLAAVIPGQLTATVHGLDDDPIAAPLLAALSDRAGRVLWNQWPTGVSVTYAMQHGGPYPATTSVQTTSVGTSALQRFLRPVSYQNVPQSLLPPPLRDDNPWRIPQRIDGVLRMPN